MKIAKLGLVALIVAAVGLFSFHGLFSGTVKGKVSPPEGAKTAWVISATDTLNVPIQQGTFEVPDLKPGVYKVIIEAKPPFKNVAKDAVTVTDGQTSDVGEIKLSQ